MKDIYKENFTDLKPLVDRLKTTRKIVTSAMRHGLACKGTAALTSCRNKMCQTFSYKHLKCSKKKNNMYIFYTIS